MLVTIHMLVRIYMLVRSLIFREHRYICCRRVSAETAALARSAHAVPGKPCPCKQEAYCWSVLSQAYALPVSIKVTTEGKLTNCAELLTPQQ